MSDIREPGREKVAKVDLTGFGKGSLPLAPASGSWERDREFHEACDSVTFYFMSELIF